MIHPFFRFGGVPFPSGPLGLPAHCSLLQQIPTSAQAVNQAGTAVPVQTRVLAPATAAPVIPVAPPTAPVPLIPLIPPMAPPATPVSSPHNASHNGPHNAPHNGPYNGPYMTQRVLGVGADGLFVSDAITTAATITTTTTATTTAATGTTAAAATSSTGAALPVRSGAVTAVNGIGTAGPDDV
jgi:hypothetical protein